MKKLDWLKDKKVLVDDKYYDVGEVRYIEEDKILGKCVSISLIDRECRNIRWINIF